MIRVTSIFDLFLVRILYIALFISYFSWSSLAQKPRHSVALWRNNWELEIKTGPVTVFTPVPWQYLDQTNNLNIPVQTPGLASLFSLRKSLSPHFEAGYRFSYLKVQGASRDKWQDKVDVRTQVYTHCFQLQYNFKRNDVDKPLLNYFV
ncbi:MAG TPA: hypothetical protein VGK10_04345, partial [Prolixibacteraceae bacterium]